MGIFTKAWDEEEEQKKDEEEQKRQAHRGLCDAVKDDKVELLKEALAVAREAGIDGKLQDDGEKRLLELQRGREQRRLELQEQACSQQSLSPGPLQLRTLPAVS